MKRASIFTSLAMFLTTLGVVIAPNIRCYAEEEAKKNVFVSDYSSRADVLKEGEKLLDDIEQEGFVLLKNEDNILPLKKGSKITVLGKNSVTDDSKIAQGLQDSGYVVNPTILNFYKDNGLSGSGRWASPTNGTILSGYTVGETPVSYFGSEQKDSFKDYNDAAVVVIWRISGEGFDASRTMKYNGKMGIDKYKWNSLDTVPIPGARSEDDHYLQLDQNETNLLELASKNFDKVIVVMHTPSSFEMGFLDDEGHYAYHEQIKGAIYVGKPATHGHSNLGKIMQGEVNPSGKTVDTWARDFKLDPTWSNFGNNLIEVDAEHKGNQYTNLPNPNGGYRNNFVTYNEGIYSGYRYYETRGFTEGDGKYISTNAGNDMIHGSTTTEWDNWYKAHVVYPYGHGLSYTTFNQEIVDSKPNNSILTKESNIELKVKVTNTGSVKGKDIVQVYYTTPYIAGEIEKAHVILGAFAKTKELNPGESETIILTLTAKSMASYDYSDANHNSFKGYELDAGNYEIKLMKNAHEEISHISYVVSENIQYSTDEVTGNVVTNRFDNVSDYITKDLHEVYLSRNNWNATWPKLRTKLTASQDVINVLDEWRVTDGVQQRDADKDIDEPMYTNVAPTTGVDHGIMLNQMYGKEYDDEMWEDFLDQLTETQLTDLVTKGDYYCGLEDGSYGIKKSGNYDSRYGLAVRGSKEIYTYVGDIILIAQSWNVELAKRFGDLEGEEALWSKGNGLGISGWYAPSINIHRSQFAGRNSQYYGEDGLLAGKMAASMIQACQNKGLPAYLKHFAVNNQETNRCGLITWLDEQTLREVYLKGFEIGVKEGKTLGIMSALNRIGTEWAGGSYNLLTGILRNEWGFEGSVVTDSYLGDNTNCSNADQMIRAGGNLALGVANLLYNVGTPTTLNCLRNAAHGILYFMAHSNVINSFEQGAKGIESFAGKTLDLGYTYASYSHNIATAKINKTIFPNANDSDIQYTLHTGSKLPKGLTLTNKGVIEGVPIEEVNNFSFKVDASYSGLSQTATFIMSVINVNGSIVYNYENPNLGEFNLKSNESINIDLNTAKIVKPNMSEGEILPLITYKLTSDSLLPEDLSLSSDGIISGKPQKEARDYKFKVAAQARGYQDVIIEFSISLLYPIEMSDTTLKVGKIGESYVCKINETVSDIKVSYKLDSDSNLPNGLSLLESGYIVGIPKETVTNHKFRVIGYSEFGISTSKEYTISIGLKYGFIIPSVASVGKKYSLQIDVAQGANGISYALQEGTKLPKGLVLTSDGTIEGTPKEAGKFEITLVATADGKIMDTTTFTLVVEGNTINPIIIIAPLSGIIIIGGLVALVIILKKKKIKLFKIKKKVKKEPKKSVKKDVAVEKRIIKKSGKQFKVVSIVFAALSVFLVTVSIVLTQVPFLYYTVCSAIGDSERYLKSGNPDDPKYQYYTKDFSSKSEVLAAANKLNENICEEGFVLLKNEHNTLPMSKSAKVTVFGKNSTNLVLGGSGSNVGTSSSKNITLYESLSNAGISYNPIMKSYLESSESGYYRPSAPEMGSIITGFPISEAKPDYPTKVKDSYQKYNDYAIVVISRIGGEGFDLPRSMRCSGDSITKWPGTQTIEGARNGDDHYLQLDQNETAMLNEACSNFEKVVLIINSASPLELGFLDDPTHYAYHSNIESALWIGAPGASGVNALGKILVGDINPSGRTVDTYPRDFKKDPTWYNFSNNLSNNANSYIYNNKEINAWFVEYREGIYFGYKYYETKAKEDGKDWYDTNVVYPFGYGLSYTTFDLSVINNNEEMLTKDGKLTFEIEVTNTGKYDGKDVVELYYSAPYTSGEIEKAHVNLGGFAKTSLITKDNGKDKVFIEINVRDLASYDYNDANGNGFKGYELDAGEYTFYIGDNAHCWSKVETPSFKFKVPEGGFKYENDSETNTTIKNLFDNVGNHIKEYLSRKDNFANFDSALTGAFSTANRTVDEEFVRSLTWKLNDQESDPYYSNIKPIQAEKEPNSKKIEVKLYDLIGKDYNDPLWDKLLNQLSVKQMSSLIATGNFRTLAIESIDKPETIDADGPMGFALFMGSPVVYNTCYYASETVLGSTYNTDLAYAMGKMIGNEGLIGNEKGDGRVYSGWYAPAVNIHRSQFGGRNFEYYSEDAFLSSQMAKNVIKGAKEKGVYTYLKHFALNEQETKRDDTGLITWANEQAMREIYFKPFEISVKEGKTTAMMSSFNRIGTVWTGGSYDLLTNLLRKEWGFNGMVITDFNLKSYMNTDQMIRAGGDINLSGGKAPTESTSSTSVTSIRRACKNILYTVANSCAMNGYGDGIVWAYRQPWWLTWLIIATVGTFAVSASFITTYIIKNKKRR